MRSCAVPCTILTPTTFCGLCPKLYPPLRMATARLGLGLAEKCSNLSMKEKAIASSCSAKPARPRGTVELSVANVAGYFRPQCGAGFPARRLRLEASHSQSDLASMHVLERVSAFGISYLTSIRKPRCPQSIHRLIRIPRTPADDEVPVEFEGRRVRGEIRQERGQLR